MIVVNPSTRQFNIPGADLVFGVESDNSSVIKEFQCPRYVGNNLDLADSFIRMNYRNANGEIDEYLVKDVTVDGNNIVFGWELTPKVTMYKGQISFVMCVVGPDTRVKWHTTLGKGQVLEGLEPDTAIVEEGTADVVAQLIAMVEAQTAAVKAEGDAQIANVRAATQAAQDAAVAEVEAKGENARNSIPSDYTALSEDVDSVIRGKAPGIVCEATGPVITVSDASDMAVQNLRIFGRSTQDGIPTLDAPIEIKSVESPAVMVTGKNLLPPSTGTISAQGITTAPTNGGTVILSGTATQEISRVVSQNFLLAPGKYTLSVTGIHTVDGNKDRVYLNAADGSGTIVNYVMVGKPVTFELASSLVIRAAIVFAPGSTYENEVAYLQLEAGDTATPYEPYKPVQTIETTRPLHGLPVTDGGNYTDENGQRWICDEVDLERGVHIQRIVRRVYDGTEQFDVVSTEEKGLRVVTDWLNVAYPNSYILCSHLRNKREIPGITQGLNSRPSYFIPFTSATEWTDYLAEQHANGTPMVAMVPAAVPVETPLSETEIAAYRALRTYKPNTTIVNDSGAYMSVEYAADTKLYIDNKIAALLGH